MDTQKRGNDESRDKPFRVALRELGKIVEKQTIDTWTGKMDKILAEQGQPTQAQIIGRMKLKRVWGIL